MASEAAPDHHLAAVRSLPRSPQVQAVLMRSPEARQSNGARFAAVLLVAVLTLSGCFSIPSSAIDRAVAAIDGTTTQIAAESQDWQLAMESMLRNLDKEARELIEGPVRQLIERSIGAAQTGIACVIDLIEDRVVDGLAKIRASLKHETYAPPAPSLCLLSPASISLAQPAADRQKIEIFGYDFDSSINLQITHVTQPQPVDVSTIFTRQTPYHATLAVDRVPIGPMSESITIAGAKKGVLYTVPIFQVPARSCQRKEEVVAPPPVHLPANLGRGDPEFFGNGPTISSSFSYQNSGSAVTGRLTIAAQETFQHPIAPVGTWLNGDTYAEGEINWPLYEAPNGWDVVSFTPSPKSDHYTARDNSLEPDIRPGSGTTLLKQWTVVGDINGIDVGVPNGTSVTATFQPLRVSIAERPGNEGCV